MTKNVLILLAFVIATEAMMRPVRIPNYNDCSCENHEDHPCDEDGEPTPPVNEKTSTTKTTPTTPKPTSTSIKTSLPTSPTTTPTTPTTPSRLAICSSLAYVPFKRKSGWWCMNMYTMAPNLNPATYNISVGACFWEQAVISSFETAEEWIYYQNAMTKANISHVWMGAGYNNTTQQYYWNDGFTVPTAIEPQPTVTTPGGNVVWDVNFDLTVPGYGNLRVVEGNDKADVRGYICGRPGVATS